MNLNLIFNRKKIENLTYDSVVTERPMSHLVSFDYKTILPEPPANTSTTTQKELEIVSKATLNRSKKDYDLIYGMDKDIDKYYISFLEKYRLEYPYEYINSFYSVVENILMNTKWFFNRPRPAQLAPFYGVTIEKLETETIHTPSYPSGHTVYSKLVANILTKIYPQFAKNFDNIVDATAEARVKQGVHYPSDNKASIEFANYVYKKLFNKI